jgi:hypothetical protein
MVGTWQGTSSSPWAPPVMVRLTFHADGSYSKLCFGGCSAFYYDEPGNFPGQRWEMSDVASDQTGFGRIALPSSFGGGVYGSLERVVATPTQLHFELWNTWGPGRYGPIVYSLTRL